jgi:hypothetical protein
MGPRVKLITLASPGGWGAVTLAHDVGSPADVDRVVATMTAAGGSLLKAPTATDWGGYSGYVADPDGHPWRSPTTRIGRSGPTVRSSCRTRVVRAPRSSHSPAAWVQRGTSRRSVG